MTQHADPFKARTTLSTPLGPRQIFQLNALGDLPTMPYSIRVLLEAVLRNLDGFIVTEDDVRAVARYDARNVGEIEIPFMPGRVVLQDFTGVPCVVDLAAMRNAMQRMGRDPMKVNPLVPCDLVIDHSVQVDAFGTGAALTINSRHEFERNSERYALLKWAQQKFENFRVVPPATGIVHQVNLEYLARVVWERENTSGPPVLYPDSCVGTDSHTTMINGLGVVGWGVGGIEAEAVMLGQPIYMLLPEVVGFRLTGTLRQGVTATDLVLTVTQMLRAHGVVNKFVEFIGDGLASMPVATRATIANMAPEYGATIGFFPIDGQTLAYLRQTNRSEAHVGAVEQYCRHQGLWRDSARENRFVYSSMLELDMSTVEPSLVGPRRPQDRVALSDMRNAWRTELPGFLATAKKSAAAAAGTMTAPTATAVAAAGDEGVPVMMDGEEFALRHGAVVIAAITSCTNTSNPDVMVAAGLVAKKAREKGLMRKPWVKTSLAPGSKVVTEYLNQAGLTEYLDELGFNTVGYGCTTCIGNSGPLPDAISAAINDNNLVVASVLSGNRNFEGRIHADVKANYLASPPLVVVYALTGTVDIDVTKDPIGVDPLGKHVYLRDIWPTPEEVRDIVSRNVTRQQFQAQYAHVFDGSSEWRAIAAPTGHLYEWDARSTYIQEPPFFRDMAAGPRPVASIRAARCLLLLGDSVTTDHISPAGSIKKDSPAGAYLIAHGVPPAMFNSYGSRRGNDRVMVRGTFANTRIRNKLADGREGGFTKYLGKDNNAAADAPTVPVFDAAVSYGACQTSDPDINRAPDGTPLIILAGKDYGMGSSRDWAAKGTFLLGVKAVIAESFERIHRSNLVGMGVLPLTFKPGQNAGSLGLDGAELFDIDVPDPLLPRQDITVRARKPGGAGVITFTTTCRVDTPVEVEYMRNGGILQTVLRKMAAHA
ncbi:MAG: aconitate hydratase AcnA [Phycisphaerales bacterium]|nr:aconitate hydratase AcnA [Phycisphaerales bacterium]